MLTVKASHDQVPGVKQHPMYVLKSHSPETSQFRPRGSGSSDGDWVTDIG